MRTHFQLTSSLPWTQHMLNILRTGFLPKTNPPLWAILLWFTASVLNWCTQTYSITSLVTRAGESDRFSPCRLPICRYTGIPVFEAVLGPGPIYSFTARRKGREEYLADKCFHIGWKLREDGQINEALCCLYPFHSFSMDLIVVQIGDRGEAVCTMEGTIQACMVIREYVHFYYLLYLTLTYTTGRFLEDLHSKLFCRRRL